MDFKIISLLLFTVMFVAIGLWVCFRPNAKKHYDEVSNIPLSDDQKDDKEG